MIHKIHKIRNWFKNTFHICKWETVKRYNCNAFKASLFGNVHKVKGELEFYRCNKCGKVGCNITDGEDTQSVDAGFYARMIMRDLPSAANDPLIQKIAKE